MTLSFFILAAISVAGVAAAMSLRNLVHCVLSLTVGLIGLAALFLDLGAEFAGFTQILVYVGAVAILAMFAIMMTRSAEPSDDPISPAGRISGALVALGVFAVLARAIYTGRTISIAAASQPDASVHQIGTLLIRQFALPLEVIGLLLTAALIGAGVIAMEERRSAR